MDNFRLTTIFETGDTDDPLDEIVHLAREISSDIDVGFITTVHDHIVRAFIGDNPEFKASNTEYHNLRHTCSVVLATIRLFHGLTINNRHTAPEIIEQGLLSAYFHDTGLLLKADDATKSGARYTKDHEKRSIHFLSSFLSDHPVPPEYLVNCSTIIDCTNLEQDISKITFPSKEVEQAAWVVASADILGQMADRYYLEQLPMLYRERRIGGVNKHKSVAELMQQTTDFYNKSVVHRLEVQFQDIAQVMQNHFKQRWGVDSDLYKENIQKNITYLTSILNDCHDELRCIQNYLRRTQPPFVHNKEIREPQNIQ